MMNSMQRMMAKMPSRTTEKTSISDEPMSETDFEKIPTPQAPTMGDILQQCLLNNDKSDPNPLG